MAWLIHAPSELGPSAAFTLFIFQQMIGAQKVRCIASNGVSRCPSRTLRSGSAISASGSPLARSATRSLPRAAADAEGRSMALLHIRESCVGIQGSHHSHQWLVGVYCPRLTFLAYVELSSVVTTKRPDPRWGVV